MKALGIGGKLPLVNFSPALNLTLNLGLYVNPRFVCENTYTTSLWHASEHMHSAGRWWQM